MVLLPSFLAVLAFLTVAGALREARDEEFPFQVSIQSQDKRHICGGALITPKWVLTARSCVENQPSVRVAYGSADSNNPLDASKSLRIVLQTELQLARKNSFALIELERAVEVSKTVKPAGLPTSKAELRNTTKLSGWDVKHYADVPPNLHVSDVYSVIPSDCKTSTGAPVHLNMDEFCGMDEASENRLTNLGTTVSKNAVVLGILAQNPLAAYQPLIFVMTSQHEAWIRAILDTDAQHVTWVDKIPKDSAPQDAAVSLALIGISAIFLRFI